MAENSAIEWCDATFNPWIGCTKISTAATGGGGCDNCYAAAQDKFRRWTPEGWGGPRKRTSEATWNQPVLWNKQPFVACAQCGYRCELRNFRAGPHEFTMCPRCASSDYCDARRRVFCASLADVFDNQVPPEWRAELFALIAATPNLDWLLLTKRIGNALTMLPCDFNPERYPHVAIGATVVNQEEADRDIPKLLVINARVRFLSMEPLLGPVDLDNIKYRAGMDGWLSAFNDGAWPELGCVDWVIAGGESGHSARPAHPDWVRSLRDQCAAAGVPFLFKQWGEWAPHPPTPGFDEGGALRKGHVQYLRGDGRELDGHFRPGDAAVRRVGKKAAGRLLDGVTHDGFPDA